MAITGLDPALAGIQAARSFNKAPTGTLVAGRPHCLWGLAGNPGPGAYDTTLNGANVSSSSSLPAGSLVHVDPVTGNAYLHRMALSANGQPCTAYVCDLLWTNQIAVNTAGAQAISAPGGLFPARDAAGTTNGDGVQIALVTSAAASATAAAGTLTYTNQAGTGSRTAGLIDATAASATAAGALFRFGMQAGDTGVRTPTNITMSTPWTTGTINLIAYRVLTMLLLGGNTNSDDKDWLTMGGQRLFNGTTPFVFIVPTATTTTAFNGLYVESQG